MNTEQLPEDILASHSGYHADLLTGALLNEQAITPSEAIASMQEYGSHCIKIDDGSVEEIHILKTALIEANKQIEQQSATIYEFLEAAKKAIDSAQFSDLGRLLQKHKP